MGSRGHENPGDQDRGSPGLLPFSHLPVQSPKPEVLAPDTSCSKVALVEDRRRQQKPLSWSPGVGGEGAPLRQVRHPAPSLPPLRTWCLG